MEKKVAECGKCGLLAGGLLLGTVGVSILKSDDAKKVYTQIAAACKRASNSVMTVVDSIKENFEDICADADDLNEERAREKELNEIADAKAILEAYEAKQAAQTAEE